MIVFKLDFKRLMKRQVDIQLVGILDHIVHILECSLKGKRALLGEMTVVVFFKDGKDLVFPYLLFTFPPVTPR